MADPKQIAYGRAGGRGQGLSRFDVAGDPSAYFPIWAAGGVMGTTPAWLTEARGSSFRYGQDVIGGTRNMLSDGNVLRPVMNADGAFSPTLRLLLGNGSYNAITAPLQNYSAIQADDPTQFSVNGELGYRDTTGAANIYGAATEGFTFAGSTVTVANGGTTATVTLANGLTTAAALTGPYGYTPSKNRPSKGDLIEIVQAGVSHWHRISSINSGVAATIFPAYTGAGGAGLTYRLWRSGYGSFSRGFTLYNGTDRYHYYVGTSGDLVSQWGVVYCVKTTAAGVVTHYTCPRLTDALGVDTGVDVSATDVAYFKGFCLVGAGPGVSWSKPGFPVTFPFDLTTYPAAAASAFNVQGKFVTFEQYGEQLVAIFDNGIFLVQATGVVPEFNFYRLPEPVGALMPEDLLDEQVTGWLMHTRPSCSGRSVFYVARDGVHQLAGLQSERISQDVENTETATALGSTFDYANLSYCPYTDSVVVSPAKIAGAQAQPLVYQVEQHSWQFLDLSALGTVPYGVTLGPVVSQHRAFSLSYWRADKTRLALGIAFEADVAGASQTPWTWPSPIVAVGNEYEAFQFGGFQILARAAALTVAPVNLTWKIYAGSSPYKMTQVETGTVDYSFGFVNSGLLVGGRRDEPFLAIVLSGASWVELAGVAIYNSATKARR